jgi:hypothetical protein
MVHQKNACRLFRLKAIKQWLFLLLPEGIQGVMVDIRVKYMTKQMNGKNLYLAVILILSSMLLPLITQGEEGDCPNGYTWSPQSGRPCIQEDCNDIPDAHWSYVGDCVCGSSGSMYENPEDPNKECAYPPDYEACPGCVYACVHLDEDCPDEKDTLQEEAEAEGDSGGEEESVIQEDDQGSETYEEDFEDEWDWDDGDFDWDSEEWEEDFEDEWDWDDEDFDWDEDEGDDNDDNDDNDQGDDDNDDNDDATDTEQAKAPPLSTKGTQPKISCSDVCKKWLFRAEKGVVVSAEGEYPDCKCQVEHRDKLDRLVKVIEVDGDIKTTYDFDPETGGLKKREKISLSEERERIRKKLGYKYTEEQIDKLLSDQKVNDWFKGMMKDIKTETSLLTFSFWWQHIVAILDHGFSKSDPDFVDTYQFGRCGDSMKWLEKNLAHKLGLTDDRNKAGTKSEAMLSITGEKYKNILNHTGLMIRPSGISNQDWADMVKALKGQSGGAKGSPGMLPKQINNIDPRLLDAKVLDPYKKEVTTVREFIKGWSYIRIS